MQIKTCKDYYEEMYKLFPKVPKADVRRAMNYGWKCLYLYNSQGADVIVKDSNFWSYIGYLKKDSLKYFKYYINKLSVKLKILYKRYGVKWDGYYYFALRQTQYDDYISQRQKRGRKRKYYTFTNLKFYKIKDVCKIQEAAKRYIFRIPYNIDMGYTFFLRELKTDKAELIEIRKPLKFKDILINDNEYELL